MYTLVRVVLVVFGVVGIARADFVSNLIQPADLGIPQDGLIFRYQAMEKSEGSEDRRLYFIIQAVADGDLTKLRKADIRVMGKKEGEWWEIEPKVVERERGIRFELLVSEKAARSIEVAVTLPERTVYDSLYRIRVANFWELGPGNFGKGDALNNKK